MITIGRREYVILADLSALPIEAKVDTGAFPPAVHCIDCTEITTETGEDSRYHFCFAGVQTIVTDFQPYHHPLVRPLSSYHAIRHFCAINIPICG